MYYLQTNYIVSQNKSPTYANTLKKNYLHYTYTCSSKDGMGQYFLEVPSSEPEFLSWIGYEMQHHHINAQIHEVDLWSTL